MRYVHSLPLSPSFDGKGLLGFVLGPLQERDLEIYYIESDKGHDTFTISRRATRVYYVIDGSGHFTISDQRYDVSGGELVEIPPQVEYSYSGRMKLIAVSKPRYFEGNDRFTRWNPDVIHGNVAPPPNAAPWEIFGRRLINRYVRVNRRLWRRLPVSLSSLGPVHLYGELLHKLARRYGGRAQDLGTYFLRNRPQLELIRRVSDQKAKGDTLNVAVLGCSVGAEAYSIAWRIRSARPDLKLVLHAVDVSRRAVEVAECGKYSHSGSQLAGTDIFERMSEPEITEMFDCDEESLTIKAWVREGIRWQIGDVAEPETINAIGPQDIVVANNFLCHMNPSMAERCLRNIAQMVRPHGHLFVSGIDLDVRTKLADELGWRPLPELIEESHDGDPSVGPLWPWHYAGLEPLDKKRADWKRRYAAAFQLSPCVRPS